MRKFISIIGLLLTAVCFADNTIKLPHTIKVGDHYLFAGPALQIAYGAIGMVEVSDDCRYIAFQYGGQLNRTKINYSPESTQAEELAKDPNNGLYVYDRVAKQSSLVQRLAVQGAILESATWVQGLSLLYLEYATESGYTAAFYSPQTKKFTVIANRAGNQPIYRQLLYVPNQKAVVAVCTAYNEGVRSPVWLEFYDSNGNFVKLLNPKSELNYKVFFVQNGALLTQVYDRNTRTLSPFELNLNTGELFPSSQTEVSNRIDPNQLVAVSNIEHGGIFLTSATHDYDNLTPISSFTEQSIPPASVSGSGSKVPKEKQQVLVITKDGLMGEVIGMNQGVWYMDRSGLYVLDLVPISAKDYEVALIDVIKRETMSRAKQVGTAMMIYGADYDDCFPLAQGWAESIYPYMKNSSLTDGFVYMMNGENMTEIEDITGTIVGFIETPYGTAYVRGDSSVVWKDKPKPLAYLKSLEALRN